MIPHSRPTIDNSDVAAVSKVIETLQIAGGNKVSEFEEKMSGYVGVKGAVATNSGTSAIHLALSALDVGVGEEVIIPSYVCTALVHAIHLTGGTPVIADINLNDLNISFEDVKRKLTKKTKAIIIPHMFGLAAELDSFLKLDVPIIEDLAMSIGASYNGKKVGGFGVLAICSFYATKMIASGEGGMVLSNSLSLLDKIRDLKEYDNKDDIKQRYNYKLTDIQAALGLNQLLKLDNFIEKRKEIAGFFNEKFKGQGFSIPQQFNDRENIYYRYIIKVNKDLTSVIKELKEKNVSSARPVFKPIHQYYNEDSSKFPMTEKVCRHALSLPIYPSLKYEEMDCVANSVIEVLKK